MISFNKVKEISLCNAHHVSPEVHSVTILASISMKSFYYLWDSFGLRHTGEHFREERLRGGNHGVCGRTTGEECENVFAGSADEQKCS